MPLQGSRRFPVASLSACFVLPVPALAGRFLILGSFPVSDESSAGGSAELLFAYGARADGLRLKLDLGFGVNTNVSVYV